MEIDLIQIVVQAGAVGIVIMLIFSQRKEREQFIIIITNHINHNTEAMTGLTQASKEQIEVNREIIKFLKNGGSNKNKN